MTMKGECPTRQALLPPAAYLLHCTIVWNPMAGQVFCVKVAGRGGTGTDDGWISSA